MTAVEQCSYLLLVDGTMPDHVILDILGQVICSVVYVNHFLSPGNDTLQFTYCMAIIIVKLQCHSAGSTIEQILKVKDFPSNTLIICRSLKQ